MTDLIEVRVSNLIGAPLDWAVAVATDAAEIAIGEHGVICIYDTPEGGCWTNLYQPSKDCRQCGLLVAHHRVSVIYSDETCDPCAWTDQTAAWYGPTPLIAACRALVATKLGDTVQVPKELMP